MSLATARAALESNEERREERWWTLANKAGGGTYDKMFGAKIFCIEWYGGEQAKTHSSQVPQKL